MATLVLAYLPGRDNSGKVAGTAKEFRRRLLLLYPRLKRTQHLLISIPEDETALLGMTRFVTANSPNVTISHLPPCVEVPSSGEFDIIRDTSEMLRERGIYIPFNDMRYLEDSTVLDIENDLGIDSASYARLSRSVNTWSFDVYSLSTDELLTALFIVMKNTLALPGIPPQVVPSDSSLLYFLALVRTAYKPHVYFHSFAHCVDVSQAIYLLMTTLDPWNLPAADILGTVLAGIGHDLLHPGLEYGILTAAAPEFSRQFPSLEEFHYMGFETLLNATWPSLSALLKPIHRYIRATQLSKHRSYLQGKPGIEHAIKFADFASIARPGRTPNEPSSIAIFMESRVQFLVSHALNIDPIIKFDMLKPPSQSLINSQVRFLSGITVPYLEWLSVQLPQFCQFAENARMHLTRWEEMQRTGKLDMTTNFSLAGATTGIAACMRPISKPHSLSSTAHSAG